MNREMDLARRRAKGFGALGAGTDVAEMVVAVDAGGVAVGEADLNGVVAYLSGALGARLGLEAASRGNGFPVRTRLRVPEGGANALGQLGADDGLELAGLRMGLGFVDGKSVLEEALGQTVTSGHVARPLAAHGRELHLTVLHLHQAQIRHAR